MVQIVKNAEKNGRMISEARKAAFSPSWFVQWLIFLLVYAAGSIVMTIAESVAMFAELFSDSSLMSEYMSYMSESKSPDFDAIYEFSEKIVSSNGVMLTMLFSEIALIAAAVIYCRFIEKRSLVSMGFDIKKINHYIYGLGIGALMFSGAVGISVLCGAGTLTVNENVNIGIIIAYFFGFLIQGAAEEILLRGYLMMSMGSKKRMGLAIGATSVLFAIMHMGNNGISFAAFVNLVLYAVVMAFYILKTDNIWGACALHSIWNFVQGNVFGINVSGTATESIFTYTQTGSVVITGGEFGLEGGLCVTLVLLVMLGFLVFYKVDGNNEEPSAETDGDNTEI